MSYIGKKPTSSFASATSQTFTGNNSTTAFTLNRRVSAPEDLEVFVSNIQQQPTTSYTIGSTGLALNFDSAPPSGQFYVVYRSEAGTSAIDVGAARTANANTFTGTNTFNADVSLPDNVTLNFGTGNDLQISHSGTQSMIKDAGTGQLRMIANNFHVRNSANDASMIKAVEGGSVTLYHNNAEKLKTQSDGVDITGQIDMNGGEVILDADGDTSITADSDDHIDFKVGGTDKMTLASGGTLKLTDITATTSSIANSANTGSINTNGGDIVTGRIFFTGDTNSGSTSNFYGINPESSRLALYDYQNNAYKMIITNGGNVGLVAGCFRSSPNNSFHNGAGTTGNGLSTGDFCEFTQNKNEFILMLKNTNSSSSQSHGLYITHATNHFDATSLYIQCTFSSFNRFLVYSNGASYNSSNTWGNISDERLKSDIVDAKSQWNDLKNIRVRNFKKYDTGDLVQLGVVAQEVEKVSPSLIQEVEPCAGDVEHNSVFGRLYTDDDPETKPTLYTESDDIPEDKKVGDEKEPAQKKVGDVKQNEPVKAIKYSVLYMKAIKALQEAMERIETLEAKVEALESK